MDKKKKIICFGLIGVAVLAILLVLYLVFFKKDNKDKTDDKGKPVIAEKKLEIIDLESNSRPYAVMINNLNAARNYHSGLQDAYLVYEIMVEAGITRLMAVFKDQDTAKIGSVRSSRHYYLDYALENDAIYVHYGWSTQAESDIAILKVNNINGLYDNAFWRESGLPIDYEHTAYTSIDKIESVASNKGYRMTSDKDTLLNYSVDEIDLSSSEDAIVANKVDVKYSSYVTSSYKYDSEDKMYYRSVNGVSHSDYSTKKQYTTKNIIIAFIDNYDIAYDSKGRQELDNIGSGDGYYITNGYSVPITWTKSTRTGQTKYKLASGEEIKVNDGNTYIQIAPLNSATIGE